MPTPRDLESNPNIATSTQFSHLSAIAINNNSHILMRGHIGDTIYCFVWRQFPQQNEAKFSNVVCNKAQTGFTSEIWLSDINDADEVVGKRFTNQGNIIVRYRADAAPSDVYHESEEEVYANEVTINNNKTVLVSRTLYLMYGETDYAPHRWLAGGVKNPLNLPRSDPDYEDIYGTHYVNSDMNNFDEVVGSLYITLKVDGKPVDKSECFFYGSSVRETLYRNAEREGCSATSINDNGEIVGGIYDGNTFTETGYIWGMKLFNASRTSKVKLETLISPYLNIKIVKDTHINNQGWIIAQSKASTYLMTPMLGPVPENR